MTESDCSHFRMSVHFYLLEVLYIIWGLHEGSINIKDKYFKETKEN